MLDERLDCVSGQYNLIRPGAHPKQPLRAWDAADEYLINHTLSHSHNNQIIILNDQFGALGCCLHNLKPQWISDSFCAHEALKLNRIHNKIEERINTFDSLSLNIKTNELALLKLPKNTSFLEYQLSLLLELGVKRVFISGMMKHLPKNLLTLLQKFGPVERLPFIKKATLFDVSLQNKVSSNYPKINRFYDVELISHANVFGRDKLDPGAQFFLENIKHLPEANQIADLCCGSGILGLKYALSHPDSQVDFFDESFMAVESARLSWEQNKLQKECYFHWNDGLGSIPKQYDLILCNPPFHEAHTVGDHIARRLFKQSKRSLRNNGHLIVVGNRHLNYHQTLKKFFKHVEQISNDPKFVLLSAYG